MRDARDGGAALADPPGREAAPGLGLERDEERARARRGRGARPGPYVFMTAATFLGMFASLGVELPWITSVVLEHPTGVPAALLAASWLVLVLGGVRRPPSPHVDVRAATRLLAALVGAAACGCIAANALVFATIHRALQN